MARADAMRREPLNVEQLGQTTIIEIPRSRLCTSSLYLHPVVHLTADETMELARDTRRALLDKPKRK